MSQSCIICDLPVKNSALGHCHDATIAQVSARAMALHVKPGHHATVRLSHRSEAERRMNLVSSDPEFYSSFSVTSDINGSESSTTTRTV